MPAEIRVLAPWASRYGIGDDVLDGFPRGKMTTEAAAFLYLAEGVEEIR